MNKLFKIKEKGSTVRAEIIGGLTTFFAMAYIIFVNPTMLSATGIPYGGVFAATCIAAAIGTFLTAVLANAPFAQAPGMGLNAFFTYTVCLTMGYTWNQALTIVLISGILFLLIAVSPLRKGIIASIPAPLKAAISAGIGLFIAYIGIMNAGIVTVTDNVPALNLKTPAALLALIGVVIIAILMAWKVKGALFIGIIITAVIGIPMGVTVLPESLTALVDFSTVDLGSTAFKLDFTGVLANGWLPLITAVISFLIVDMFDTVGTLLGTAGNAGMLDENGNLPGGDRAIIADAIATCAGAVLGTSTVTTFVESSAGISEGAKTGLSSIVVSVLFVLALVLAPVAGLIPSAATAPALIIVGVLMMKGVTKIAWDNIEEAIPCFLVVAMMPFAYSISDGIGMGFISYTILKMARGKFKEVPVLMYILSAVFVVTYVLRNI